jgi:RsiW-degrading membrane proteinase PrsW (M82 family)
MKFFVSYNGHTYGPYLQRDVIDWWKVHQIPDNALICKVGSEEWHPINSMMPGRSISTGKAKAAAVDVPSHAVISSTFEWLIPWRIIVSFQWLNEGGLIALLIIGLSPIVAVTFFPDFNAYWTVSVYFSLLWAFFLYHFFKTPETRFIACVVAFFFTPLFSVATLLEAQKTFPLLQLDSMADSPEFWTRFSGFLFGVGLSEELCKAAIVLLIVWRARAPSTPSTIVLYGMMSGLGFGIFEGIFYQQYVNPSAGEEAGYLLNILRLTSLPFLHSIWAGLAAYFIGTARFINAGRWLTTFLGLVVAAFLHGMYDFFSGSWPSVVVCVGSVVLILIYLFNSQKLENNLRLANDSSVNP